MIKSCITFLPVTDIKKTVEFYRDIIGLKVDKDEGNCVIFSCGEGYWGFCSYNDGRKLPIGVCMSLNLENNEEVDSEYHRISKLGIEATKPVKHPNFPVYSFFMKDPDGYTVELQKRQDD